MPETVKLRINNLVLELETSKTKSKPLSTKQREKRHLNFVREKGRRNRAGMTWKKIILNC